MTIVLLSLTFAVAALCAGLMGFAIQRGGTCTVAAIDDIVTRRSFNHFFSLFEAALWVGGGLLAARALHQLPAMPAAFEVNRWTVIGGALLGFGAFVNRACVFGTIARFGSGQWAYLASPVGFYVGCVSVSPLFAPPVRDVLSAESPVLQAPTWLVPLFLVFIAWRMTYPLLHRSRRDSRTDADRWRDFLARRVWTHHSATMVIGITFFLMLLLVGSWAYTDVLVELAHGMSASLLARCLLLVALLAGATLGGWTAGRFRSTQVSLAQSIRCFIGGLLMGWGSVLIPGGNDGLILVGMPLAFAYAWVAFTSMCLTIALAQITGARRADRVGKRLPL